MKQNFLTILLLLASWVESPWVFAQADTVGSGYFRNYKNSLGINSPLNIASDEFVLSEPLYFPKNRKTMLTQNCKVTLLKSPPEAVLLLAGTKLKIIKTLHYRFSDTFYLLFSTVPEQGVRKIIGTFQCDSKTN